MPARATLTGGTGLVPVWSDQNLLATLAPVFLLHPGSSTALGPLALSMKYISEHLSNVGRGVGFCLLFPIEEKFNRSQAFLIPLILSQVAMWFSGYMPAQLCPTLGSGLCLKKPMAHSGRRVTVGQGAMGPASRTITVLSLSLSTLSMRL